MKSIPFYIFSNHVKYNNKVIFIISKLPIKVKKCADILCNYALKKIIAQAVQDNSEARGLGIILLYSICTDYFPVTLLKILEKKLPTAVKKFLMEFTALPALS